MANVVIFKPNQTPQYLQSVNTPDYTNDPDVLVDPNLSLVSGVPLKYWKRVGNLVQEMSASEKLAVDDAELLSRKSVADNYQVDIKTALTALVKVINIRLSAGQKITKQEMIDALKLEIT